MSSDPELDQKFSGLLAVLKEARTAALAFSGGVDSTFLLKAMDLAGMQFIAVTAVSPTMPEADYQKALSFAEEAGVRHLVIRTDELANEKFVRNAPDRCFHCKDELFGKMEKIAEEHRLAWIFDGTNADDLFDYRPGRKAASLHRVRSPLAECNFMKQDIRALSKKLGLHTWDQPASPCLSSRFPYGCRITAEALKRVEAAEQFLKSLGLGLVRVRDHGDTARIEVQGGDMQRLTEPATRLLVAERFHELGYLFISLDLEGYKTGSMNRVLEQQH
ncbi:MAG: TIGR00268 family protein [Thermodesulfovibrio sp.]|nr:TIGR00268 family protein [Thermodesulfovibrio sp.]